SVAERRRALAEHARVGRQLRREGAGRVKPEDDARHPQHEPDSLGPRHRELLPSGSWPPRAASTTLLVVAVAVDADGAAGGAPVRVAALVMSVDVPSGPLMRDALVGGRIRQLVRRTIQPPVSTVKLGRIPKVVGGSSYAVDHQDKYMALLGDNLPKGDGAGA